MKKVLITGGTGSIGQSLVRRFVTDGYEVTFQFSSKDGEAKKLSVEIGAIPLKLDFRKNVTLEDNEFDVLVNSAGINKTSELSGDVTYADWFETMQVNLTAPFQLIQQCLPHMCSNKWGRIININSIYGLIVVEQNLPYNVSKHGLTALTKTIAREYARFNITSNEICPGPVESELMLSIARREGGSTNEEISRYFSEVKLEIPAGRLALPEDISNLTSFLATKEAGYLNGVSIRMDGGMVPW